MGDCMPDTKIAQDIIRNIILGIEEKKDFQKGVKKIKGQSSRIKMVNFEALHKELDVEAEIIKRGLGNTTQNSLANSPRNSAKFKSSPIKKAVSFLFDPTKVSRSKNKLKSLLQLSSENNSQVNSTRIHDSKQESLDASAGSKGNGFLIKSSRQLSVGNRSFNHEKSVLTFGNKNANASQVNPTPKSSSTRNIQSALESKPFKAQCKNPLSLRGKSELTKYFITKSQEPPKKPRMFFTGDDDHREYILPKRKFKHTCFASALPNLLEEIQDDGKFKGESPDYDIFTVQPAPVKVYFANNDLAGMMDDCLLSTFHNNRNSKDVNKDSELVAKDNINKRLVSITRFLRLHWQANRERECFKFIRKGLKNKKVDFDHAKGVDDFGKINNITMMGTDGYIRTQVLEDSKARKMKNEQDTEIIKLIGKVCHGHLGFTISPMKKLQQLIYDHRQVTPGKIRS